MQRTAVGPPVVLWSGHETKTSTISKRLRYALQLTPRRKCWKCNMANTNCSSESSPQNANGHVFTKKTFHKPTYCHHCSDMLWGLIQQGYICEGRQPPPLQYKHPECCVCVCFVPISLFLVGARPICWRKGRGGSDVPLRPPPPSGGHTLAAKTTRENSWSRLHKGQLLIIDFRALCGWVLLQPWVSRSGCRFALVAN